MSTTAPPARHAAPPSLLQLLRWLLDSLTALIWESDPGRHEQRYVSAAALVWAVEQAARDRMMLMPTEPMPVLYADVDVAFLAGVR